MLKDDKQSIIDAVYSQDISTIDSDIDSLISQQFSSFYQQYADFSIISNFLSYRVKSYLKFLQNFSSTSEIFPINLRYNLGLSNLVNIKYTQYSDINLYEYITKRGSKELFNRIANNLKLGGIEQLVLTSVDPYVVIGERSKKRYSIQLLHNTISDIDLVNKDDIPVFLPIYSMIKEIKYLEFTKFENIMLGLFFDKSSKLDIKIGPNTLRDYIISYFVIKSMRTSYTEADDIKYDTYRTTLVLPHQQIEFKELMYLKYPEISELSPDEQWVKIFRPFINEYPIYTDLFSVNTSNSDLNKKLNADIAKGDFITRLNLDYINFINTTVEYRANLFHSLITESKEIQDIYYSIYLLHKNPMYYLKNHPEHRTLYGNLLNYLLSVDVKDIFLVDYIVLIENILDVIMQYAEYSKLEVDSSEISQYYYSILYSDFVNFRPMFVVLTALNYVINHQTGIYLKSSIAKYPRLKTHSHESIVILKTLGHSHAIGVNLQSFIDIATSMFSTKMHSIIMSDLQIITNFRGTEIVDELSFIKILFEINGSMSLSHYNTDLSFIIETSSHKESTVVSEIQLSPNYEIIISSSYSTEITLVSEHEKT